MCIKVRALRCCSPLAVEENQRCEIVWFSGEEYSCGTSISPGATADEAAGHRRKASLLLDNLVGKSMEGIGVGCDLDGCLFDARTPLFCHDEAVHGEVRCFLRAGGRRVIAAIMRAQKEL